MSQQLNQQVGQSVQNKLAMNFTWKSAPISTSTTSVSKPALNMYIPPSSNFVQGSSRVGWTNQTISLPKGGPASSISSFVPSHANPPTVSGFNLFDQTQKVQISGRKFTPMQPPQMMPSQSRASMIRSAPNNFQMSMQQHGMKPTGAFMGQMQTSFHVMSSKQHLKQRASRVPALSMMVEDDSLAKKAPAKKTTAKNGDLSEQIQGYLYITFKQAVWDTQRLADDPESKQEVSHMELSLQIYEATVFAILKYTQTSQTKKTKQVLQPNCTFENFLKNILSNDKELEKAVSDALSAHDVDLKDLLKLEEQMPCNNVDKTYRDPSLTIKLTKGNQISTYGLLYEHYNKEVGQFDICTKQLFEEFKTERAHKIFMNGHANTPSNNPLLPTRIFGYQPYLATAFDVVVPDTTTDGDVCNTMRLWHMGSIYDQQESPTGAFLKMQEKDIVNINRIMSRHFSMQYDPVDSMGKYREDKGGQDLQNQQYLLVNATVKDIFESFIESQYNKDGEPPASINFSKFDKYVQIEESDPYMVMLLTTEFLRVLIDQHNFDIYDAAKVVSAIVTYKPRMDHEAHYSQYQNIKSLQDKMPRHYLLMHAISNKAVEQWMSKNTKLKNVKFDKMVPNTECNRDAAWVSLDKDTKYKVAEAEEGIYQYSFHRSEVLSVHSHRAALCLSTVGDWLKKPMPAKKTKKDKEEEKEPELVKEKEPELVKEKERELVRA